LPPRLRRSLPDIGYSPHDRANFNLLVDEFRRQLNDYADANGRSRRDFLVTAALPSPVSMFNQPLRRHSADPTGDEFNSAEDAIRYFLERGVPRKKMAFGVEFTLSRGFTVTTDRDNGVNGTAVVRMSHLEPFSSGCPLRPPAIS
jgi:chitinase